MQLVSSSVFRCLSDVCREFGWQERIQTREADTGAVRRQAGGRTKLEDRGKERKEAH